MKVNLSDATIELTNDFLSDMDFVKSLDGATKEGRFWSLPLTVAEFRAIAGGRQFSLTTDRPASAYDALTKDAPFMPKWN